jgi:protein involved in polysaccharide export with SLBB domain
MPRNLNANDRSAAFKLSPYDHISIRRAPGYSEQGTVTINGEVLYSGSYTIQNKGDRISDLVKWSGGLRPNAYPEAASFIKADAGMVGINLKKILDRPQSRFDLMLNPGDALTIPQRPQTVNVTGQVQNPFATVFMPGKGIKYYIKTSGGWSEKPDKGRIYVTYPDGSSDMTSSFIFRNYPRVKPGSHIIVPKQAEKVQHPERSAFWLAMGSTAGTLAIAVVSILSIINKTP